MVDVTIDGISVSDHRRRLRRAVIASAIGTAIEWYDFFLYGTAAGLVFGKLFFPHQDPLSATFLAFGTYFVGFIARPVGAMTNAMTALAGGAMATAIPARNHRDEIGKMAAAVQVAVTQFGRLDCAVNAAAIETETVLLHESSDDSFDRMLAVNLRGVYLSMKHELKAMLATAPSTA